MKGYGKKTLNSFKSSVFWHWSVWSPPEPANTALYPLLNTVSYLHREAINCVLPVPTYQFLLGPVQPPPRETRTTTLRLASRPSRHQFHKGWTEKRASKSGRCAPSVFLFLSSPTLQQHFSLDLLSVLSRVRACARSSCGIAWRLSLPFRPCHGSPYCAHLVNSINCLSLGPGRLI